MTDYWTDMNSPSPEGPSDARRERGQVGIGTLIVFIAMVIVAAIAAGVLINTAAMLQSTAEDVGMQSVDRVVDGVEFVGATGTVGDDGGVETVRLWIRPRPAAGDINVSDLTLKWVGDHAGQSLTFGGSGDAAPATTSDAHTTFNASDAGGDGDGTLETGEEFALLLNASQIESRDADAGNLEPLDPGARVTVEVTVAGGSTSATYLRVPDHTGGTTHVVL